MTINLTLGGPLRAGNLPTEVDAIAALDRAAVYLRVRVYAEGPVRAYVGQTTQLIARLDQHLAALTSLSLPLHDETGATVFDAAFDSRLAALNRIDEIGGAVIAELKRLRFYYALCDESFDEQSLDLVERLLKGRLETRAASAGFVCENRNAVPLRRLPDDVDTLTLESNFEALAIDDRALLQTLLGPEPVEFALAEIEAVLP